MQYFKFSLKVVTWVFPFIVHFVFGGRPIPYVLKKNRKFLILFALFLMMTTAYVHIAVTYTQLKSEYQTSLQDLQSSKERTVGLIGELERLRYNCPIIDHWEVDRRIQDLFRE